MNLKRIYINTSIALLLLGLVTNKNYTEVDPTIAYAQCKIDVLEGLDSKGKARLDYELHLRTHKSIKNSLGTEIAIILHKLCKEHYTNE